MKIVIDGRMIGSTGQGRYTTRLLDQLQQLDQHNEYVVLMREADINRWRPSAPNFTTRLAEFGQYSWGEQLKLPWLLYSLKADLVHFVSYNLPLLYFGRYVVTVHDLTLVNFKNPRAGGLNRLAYEVKYWAGRLALGWAVSISRAVMVPTKFVGDQLAQRYRSARGKVTVTYEAADDLAKPESLDRLEVAPPFILVAGNPYPYKNLGRLITAFSKLAAERSDLRLVITGGTAVNDGFLEPLKHQADRLKLSDKVIFAGFVSDGELAGLYHQTSLFVFPSLSEGFGLPGLEAMAAGAPVAAAAASCLPEVYGSAAVYFDPLDPSDMADKMTAVLNSPDQQERLRAAGSAQVKKYSWRRMAEETLAVYKTSGR